MTGRVLVVGGYGAFGALAAERLARDPSLTVIIAGRDASKAAAAADRLRHISGLQVEAASLDAAKPDVVALRALAPTVVYNAVGPFQIQDYALARAAIEVGAHYVDLADARLFVTGIAALDADARAKGVLVVAGASSVPALSSAVLEHLALRFQAVQSITYGIAPGNAFDPGIGTTASILSAIGRPFTTLDGCQRRTVHGWQGLSRFRFHGLGPRWLARVDIPDLGLFPSAYPDLRSIDFRAGLEVPVMHFGLWMLSWLAKAGLLRRPERLAGPLLTMKKGLRWFGTDTGGFFLIATGLGHGGGPQTMTWQLEARSDHGPYIPQVAATVLTRDLLAGREQRRGAMACVGLVKLPALLAEIADLDVTITEG